MNLKRTAYRLQDALIHRGRHIKINQYQAYSEKTGRMVTKYVCCEKRMTDGKMKNVTVCESYQMADVVLALSALLNDGGGG